MALSGPTCRLSVRAFTQLIDEEKNGLSVGSPLFTDTYLSLPVVTEAGEDRVPDGQTQEREREPEEDEDKLLLMKMKRELIINLII